MNAPFSFVGEIELTSGSDRELHQVDAFLEFQVVYDLIIRIEAPIILLRNGIDVDHDSVLCFRIAYRCLSPHLVILVSSPDVHMVRVFGSAGELQEAHIKRVCDAGGFFMKVRNYQRVFECFSVRGFSRFRDALAESDGLQSLDTIHVDPVGMVLVIPPILIP